MELKTVDEMGIGEMGSYPFCGVCSGSTMLFRNVNVPNNVAQLQLALIQEWNNIPQRTIDNLVGSMVRRVRAATAARGGHTRY